MTRRRSERSPQTPDSSTSPEEYDSFISQIELQDIWLKKGRMESWRGVESLEKTSVEVEQEAYWEPASDGFHSFHRYTIGVQTERERLAELDVTFELAFSSEQTMTNGIFSIFQEVNLPVNTWPYLRNFLADALSRMGWPPLTLPTLKTGPTTLGEAPPSRPRRRRNPVPAKRS